MAIDVDPPGGGRAGRSDRRFGGQSWECSALPSAEEEDILASVALPIPPFLHPSLG